MSEITQILDKFGVPYCPFCGSVNIGQYTNLIIYVPIKQWVGDNATAFFNDRIEEKQREDGYYCCDCKHEFVTPRMDEK